MIHTFPFLNKYSSFPNILWAAIAAILGLFVATQPAAVVVIVLIAVASLLLAMITPLAALNLLLILAPLRTLVATEAAFQLPLDIGQIAFAGLILFWVIHSINSRQSLPRLIGSPLYIPILLFIGITGLTAFNAVSISSWINEWLKWVQILVIIVITLSLAHDKRWEWLIFALVLSGLANALIGLYEFVGGSGALHLLINNRFFRAFGTFGQPNPFGGFMGLLAPIALMATLGYGLRLWHHRHLPDRFQIVFITFFYLIASFFIVLGIGISWSRGAWLGFAASIGVIALALPRKAWLGFALALGVGGLIAMLWLTDLLPASIVTRITSSTQEFFAFDDVRGIDITPENYAVVERLSHWQAALNMARANPWLGVGFGNYEVVYPAYRLLNWHEPLGHAHNFYLNILAETGIIGLLGYGKAWVFIMWLNWRTRQHPNMLARLIAVGLLGTWTYLSVHSMFDNLYVNNLFLHIGLMLGILAVLYNQASYYYQLRTL